jgi:hypothetical protein
VGHGGPGALPGPSRRLLVRAQATSIGRRAACQLVLTSPWCRACRAAFRPRAASSCST